MVAKHMAQDTNNDVIAEYPLPIAIVEEPRWFIFFVWFKIVCEEDERLAILFTDLAKGEKLFIVIMVELTDSIAMVAILIP